MDFLGERVVITKHPSNGTNPMTEPTNWAPVTSCKEAVLSAWVKSLSRDVSTNDQWGAIRSVSYLKEAPLQLRGNVNTKWVFPKIGVPQNGWFIMEPPPLNGWFGDITIFGNIHMENPEHLHLRDLSTLNPCWSVDGENVNKRISHSNVPSSPFLRGVFPLTKGDKQA